VQPISPELVLVDPELRRFAIADLDMQQFVFAPRHVRRIPMAATPAARVRSWRRRAAQVVILVGLAVAGIVVANVAARSGADRPVLLTSSASAASTVPPQPVAPLDGRSAVERELLDLVVQSPSTRLPAKLVDPRTGLARNNLQAICHPVGSRYACLVRPALHRPGEGLVVRYGPNGFTWYRYRRG
jgi:hypothetical protein